MISFEDIEIIHNILIENFGGVKGIRDVNLLESALSRPIATFDSIELYVNSVEKASALLESLIINHPFLDGNKRTAYTAMRLLLLNDGLDINATQEEKYAFVISVSVGEFRFVEINNWIELHLIS